MTLILQGTTKTKDLIIDYIEVQLSSGKTVSLNWDESGIDRTPEGFDAKYGYTGAVTVLTIFSPGSNTISYSYQRINWFEMSN